MEYVMRGAIQDSTDGKGVPTLIGRPQAAVIA